MVTSVIDPNETGPQGVVVTEVDQNGEKKTFKTFTNAAGILAMVAPATAALISLDRVNQNGSTTPMTNTKVIPAATETSSQAPTITETSNTVEMTGTNPGLVTLHTTGINPTATVPYIDNQPMTLRAASDTSVVATVPAGTSIGTHTFSVASEGVQSNKVQSDVITVTPEPLAVMHTGSVTNLTIDVAGIPEKHNPMVHVDVHGAAHFVDGGSSADIPVVNGKATAKIRADHPGQVTANYVVRSNIPGNSSPSTSSNTPKMPSKGVPVSQK